MSIVFVTMPPFAHEPPTGETTLMLLETWLTTHTSSSVRGFTETGPSPTGIWASRLGLAGVVTSNTESEAFGVFTANRSGNRRDHTVAIGSLVDHPHLVVGARIHGDGPQSDWNLGEQTGTGARLRESAH